MKPTGIFVCFFFFGNIAIFTNLSTLISQIIVAKLNSCVKMVFYGISK